MNKWIVEDWAFDIEVTEGDAKNCRLGLEKGDRFHFEYECPQGFCPRALIEIFTWCEVIRCGGDFTYRGCPSKYEMDLSCPCHCLQLHLTAIPVNRDGQGKYTGENIKLEESLQGSALCAENGHESF